MPSQRPSAAFEPIPPDLDLQTLVEETPNFEYVTRVSCDMVEQQSMEAFEKLVLLHVIIGGKPLVIDGFQHKLDGWTFGSHWLQDNCGDKFENARNLTKQQNMPLSISHYLSNMSKLTNQWDNTNYRDLDRQRIYLKDIDCPELWHNKLEERIPAGIFYMNENTGDLAGPGAADEHHRGIARAGDLMSSLPAEMRADNLMCYIGHEGTYTPAHREMCASLGQNLMVETSGVIDHVGKPTKPGSSIWFMTETNDRHLVSEYWLSTLGHDIEIEKHFAQINAWKAAPFTTYIVEQKAGDFILIPPLAPHQVWNRGTRTMKVAWNRTTVETLEMALHEALPRARMVCRDEQYKNKAIIYFSLQKYSALLKDADVQKLLTRNRQALEDLKYSTKIRQLQKDFKRLHTLYTEILISESLAPVSPHEKKGQYLPFEGFVTCSYCRCNIFNRFLTCTSCIISDEDSKSGEEDTYDMCLDCFAMGRSCGCISDYKWVEQFPWQELLKNHEQWRQQIIAFEGNANEKSPLDLQSERKRLGKKTLAQVCQEQLKARPWSDPKDPLQTLTFKQRQDAALGKSITTMQTEDEDDSGDEEKSPKKKGTVVRRKDRLNKDFAIEHVSLYPVEKWKVARCSRCDRYYSYGTLWRGFDLMPATVMEQFEWLCPFCLKICSCGSCRRRTGMVPYEPKGTVLGHDTSKVADPRSAEHLVNFSHSNMKWLNNAGAKEEHPLESRVLSKRIKEAEKAKARDPALDDNYVDEDNHVPESTSPTSPEEMDMATQNVESDIPIDPMLCTVIPPRNRVSKSTANYSIPGRASSTEPNATRYRTDTSTHEPDALVEMPQEIDGATEDQRHHNFVSNGITYEYPDPENADSLPPALGSATDAPDLPRNMKRKVTNDILQSDAFEATGEGDNDQFRKAQDQHALSEAKRNNRSLIAEAALSGKTLPLTLSLPPSLLAGISQSSSHHHIAGNSPGSHTPKELLRSDLPSVTRDQGIAEVSKKRKIRPEDSDDDDFGGRKRRDRHSKASTTRNVTPGNPRRKQRYSEEASASDSDEEMSRETPVPNPGRKAGEPRSLPRYLAKRTEGLDLPDELPQEEPRRRSLPGPRPDSKQQSSTTPNANGKPRAAVKGGKTKSTSGTTSTSSDQFNAYNAADRPVVLDGSAATPLPSSLKRSSMTAQQMALAAQDLAEENRKAKLKAVSWADADNPAPSSSDKTPSDDETPAKTSFTRIGTKAPMAVPVSMFARAGMAGKKIKIASAKTVGKTAKI